SQKPQKPWWNRATERHQNGQVLVETLGKEACIGLETLLWPRLRTRLASALVGSLGFAETTRMRADEKGHEGSYG
ncbi:MAG: hypothetical protein ACK5KM_05290, partial [Hyphomicrobiaceae bacterium]